MSIDLIHSSTEINEEQQPGQVPDVGGEVGEGDPCGAAQERYHDTTLPLHYHKHYHYRKYHTITIIKITYHELSSEVTS